MHNALLNITPEGELLRESKDIVEELNILIHIVKKQRDVIRRFKKHAESLLDHEGNYRLQENEGVKVHGSSITGRSDTEDARSIKSDDGFDKWKWFRTNADDSLVEADDRLEELESLHKTAVDVCQGVSLDTRVHSAESLTWWNYVARVSSGPQESAD